MPIDPAARANALSIRKRLTTAIEAAVESTTEWETLVVPAPGGDNPVGAQTLSTVMGNETRAVVTTDGNPHKAGLQTADLIEMLRTDGGGLSMTPIYQLVDHVVTNPSANWSVTQDAEIRNTATETVAAALTKMFQTEYQ